MRTAQRAISTNLPGTGCWAGDTVYLVNLFAEDETVLRVMERLPHCRMTRWNPYGVDIIAKGGGKEKGMERLMEYFRIAREETIAFGDGENDMEMLEYAGIGVAMGNAEEKVKACADYVTAAVDKGGHPAGPAAFWDFVRRLKRRLPFSFVICLNTMSKRRFPLRTTASGTSSLT